MHIRTVLINFEAAIASICKTLDIVFRTQTSGGGKHKRENTRISQLPLKLESYSIKGAAAEYVTKDILSAHAWLHRDCRGCLNLETVVEHVQVIEIIRFC